MFDEKETLSNRVYRAYAHHVCVRDGSQDRGGPSGAGSGGYGSLTLHEFALERDFNSDHK